MRNNGRPRRASVNSTSAPTIDGPPTKAVDCVALATGEALRLIFWKFGIQVKSASGSTVGVSR